MTRGLKFRIKEVDEQYCVCSENKGADQLCGDRKANLCLCSPYAKNGFSQAAQLSINLLENLLHYGCFNAHKLGKKQGNKGDIVMH